MKFAFMTCALSIAVFACSDGDGEPRLADASSEVDLRDAAVPDTGSDHGPSSPNLTTDVEFYAFSMEQTGEACAEDCYRLTVTVSREGDVYYRLRSNIFSCPREMKVPFDSLRRLATTETTIHALTTSYSLCGLVTDATEQIRLQIAPAVWIIADTFNCGGPIADLRAAAIAVGEDCAARPGARLQ